MKQMKKLKIVYSLLFVVLPIVLMTHGEIPKYAEVYESMMNHSATSNWTNCSTFLADSTFNISSVVDIDWVIFYFWTCESDESYTMRFSVPSDLLIQRIQETMVQEPEPPVNWSDAALFVDTSIDISGLFIKTNTPGLYRFLPTKLMEYKITMEILFALKVVDGYLGIINCFGKIGYALAPVYNVPKKEEVWVFMVMWLFLIKYNTTSYFGLGAMYVMLSKIDKLVAKMNVWNPFGRSYLYTRKEPYAVDHPVPSDLDDDEENLGIEIDNSEKTIEIF